MPLTQQEAELEPLAREGIAGGRLPRGVAATMWGGYGQGRPCSLCGKPIERDEVEYEVEVLVDRAAVTLRLHILCESAWRLECAREHAPR
jgi:hypothetical protein